jgi:hypothetical protein
MSEQGPWQAPDPRWYQSGQGTPSWPTGGPEPPRKRKPEKESGLVSFREWLSTTAGTISAICAVITLVGGAIVAAKALTPSPKPSLKHSSNTTVTVPSQTSPSSPNPIVSNPPSPLSSSVLQNALLPTGTVGSAAIVRSSGTDLSQIGGICGGPLTSDTATAYETIADQQSGTYLSETLISWTSAADADKAITEDRQAVDQSGSCSTSSGGATAQFTGDDAGSPPSSCVSPGQYLATQVKITSPSSTLLYFGFVTEARCGTTTITIEVISDLPGAITQQTADGYLSDAVGELESIVSQNQ